MLGIGAVAVHTRGQYAHARKLKRLGDKIYIVHVQRNFRVASRCHLVCVPNKAEAGNVRAGVHVVFNHRVARGLVQRCHKGIYKVLSGL